MKDLGQKNTDDGCCPAVPDKKGNKEKSYPNIHLSGDHADLINDWEKGKRYKLTFEAEVSGFSEGDYGRSVDLKLVKGDVSELPDTSAKTLQS